MMGGVGHAAFIYCNAMLDPAWAGTSPRDPSYQVVVAAVGVGGMGHGVPVAKTPGFLFGFIFF